MSFFLAFRTSGLPILLTSAINFAFARIEGGPKDSAGNDQAQGIRVGTMDSKKPGQGRKHDCLTASTLLLAGPDSDVM